MKLTLNDPLDVLNLKLLGIGLEVQYSSKAKADPALFPWTITVEAIAWRHTWYF